MSELPYVFPIKVVWLEQKKGVLQSATLPNLPVATPIEFSGGHAGIWSPEHLFIAAIASCFMTTFLAIAENSKLIFQSFSCDSKGYLDKTAEGKLAITKVELYPQVTIAEKDKERALKILEKAEKACLISHSVKTEIAVHPLVVTN